MDGGRPAAAGLVSHAIDHCSLVFVWLRCSDHHLTWPRQQRLVVARGQDAVPLLQPAVGADPGQWQLGCGEHAQDTRLDGGTQATAHSTQARSSHQSSSRIASRRRHEQPASTRNDGGCGCRGGERGAAAARSGGRAALPQGRHGLRQLPWYGPCPIDQICRADVAHPFLLAAFYSKFIGDCSILACLPFLEPVSINL